MSSALAFDGHICWGTSTAIHDILARAASIASERYRASNPAAKLLARELAEYWGGKVITLSEADLSADQLFEVLTAARNQALASGEFTELGQRWLAEAMATFCKEGEAATKLSGRTGPQ
ncbi:hypothetical protein WIX39_029745 [Variovorax sp. AB1(2024)]|uniref:hypothetical protein n=1 Tax=Variovorax sp. AB1(2024) TaxID=3132214 RepID=UPI003099A954